MSCCWWHLQLWQERESRLVQSRVSRRSSWQPWRSRLASRGSLRARLRRPDRPSLNALSPAAAAVSHS